MFIYDIHITVIYNYIFINYKYYYMINNLLYLTMPPMIGSGSFLSDRNLLDNKVFI